MQIPVWGLEVAPDTVLWVAFYFGILARFFARASSAYHSELRDFPSRRAFAKKNWDIFLVRTLFPNTPLFVLWLNHPDLLAKALDKIWIPPGIANWSVLVPTPISALLFGFIVDRAIDKLQMKIQSIPHLPSWLPDVVKGEVANYDADALVQKAIKTMSGS